MTFRILFVVNELDFFLSHRLPLALAARRAGYDVHVATRPSESVPRLLALGFPHHPVALSRSGMNPIAELRSMWELWRLMRRLRPALAHLVTIKPVLYGGLAARLVGVPAVVAAVSGLGFVFTRTGRSASALRWLVTRLYRAALAHRRVCVIFQNPVDRQTLVEAEVVAAKDTTIVPGSGVDLTEYAFRPEPPGPPVVVFAARLLRDKGAIEFVAAAERLRAEGCGARFLLAGSPDPGNPASIDESQLKRWREGGQVEVLGHRRDISELFASSHIVALPSYYGEGLPKVLVEAASCGRPVVTTDCPGCRDAIEPGVTGLLVAPRDVPALAAALRLLIDDSVLRQRMGAAGRQLAERRYGIERISASHLGIYRQLLASGD